MFLCCLCEPKVTEPRVQERATGGWAQVVDFQRVAGPKTVPLQEFLERLNLASGAHGRACLDTASQAGLLTAIEQGLHVCSQAGRTKPDIWHIVRWLICTAQQLQLTEDQLAFLQEAGEVLLQYPSVEARLKMSSYALLERIQEVFREQYALMEELEVKLISADAKATASRKPTTNVRVHPAQHKPSRTETCTDANPQLFQSQAASQQAEQHDGSNGSDRIPAVHWPAAVQCNTRPIVSEIEPLPEGSGQVGHIHQKAGTGRHGLAATQCRKHQGVSEIEPLTNEVLPLPVSARQGPQAGRHLMTRHATTPRKSLHDFILRVPSLQPELKAEVLSIVEYILLVDTQTPRSGMDLWHILRWLSCSAKQLELSGVHVNFINQAECQLIKDPSVFDLYNVQHESVLERYQTSIREKEAQIEQYTKLLQHAAVSTKPAKKAKPRRRPLRQAGRGSPPSLNTITEQHSIPEANDNDSAELMVELHDQTEETEAYPALRSKRM